MVRIQRTVLIHDVNVVDIINSTLVLEKWEGEHAEGLSIGEENKKVRNAKLNVSFAGHEVAEVILTSLDLRDGEMHLCLRWLKTSPMREMQKGCELLPSWVKEKKTMGMVMETICRRR
ncbi:hypothetical protein L1887_34452 [Cichorium endivia]|nr:hypothetical protein L1887_34452 [Cichorium endivia]